MTNADRLRAQLLVALGAALAAGVGCASTAVSPPTADAGNTTDTPAATDTPAPLDTPIATDSPAPTDTPVAVDSPPVCRFGTPERRCFAPDELERTVRFPPGKMEPRDGGVADAAVAGNGCYASAFVSDSCCNTAQGDPVREGDRCCYVFCTGACCGRPLLVDAQPRMATGAARTDWTDTTQPAPDAALDAHTRRALAEFWQAEALAEHASVASFARFTLSLLAVGAPAELVADAQRAGLDEVDHARRCFALAARFGGKPVGPGPLSLEGAGLDTTLREAAVSAVWEGCVGETVAALTVAAQRDACRDEAARASLAVIAEDEARHAALAWRFVRWCVATRPELAEDVQGAFAAATAAAAHAGVDGTPAGVSRAVWAAYGARDAQGAAEVRRDALTAVVAPCAAALVAG
jgi:hypothetical protein